MIYPKKNQKVYEVIHEFTYPEGFSSLYQVDTYLMEDFYDKNIQSSVYKHVDYWGKKTGTPNMVQSQVDKLVKLKLIRKYQ